MIEVSAIGMTISLVVGSTVLAQMDPLSRSATGGNESAQHAQLFNGTFGNDDGDDSDFGEVLLFSDNTVTVTFASDNMNGYDLTGIKIYFGWDTGSGEGDEMILTYVDGAKARVKLKWLSWLGLGTAVIEAYT